MTRGPESGGATAVPFHGPADLRPLWNRFVSVYTNHGTCSSLGAAALDDLAFGRGAAVMAGLFREDPASYRQRRRALEHAAQALSDQTGSAELRPLHRAVVSALVGRWIELKKSRGLHVQDAGSDAAPNDPDRALSREHHAALLRTPEGGALAGALKMAHDRIIRAETSNALKRCDRRVSHDDVLPLAYDHFDRSLFKYEPGHDMSFSAYAHGALKNFLPVDVRRRFVFGTKQDRELRNALASGPPEEWTDDRAVAPHDALARAERDAILDQALDRLPPRERYILRLRFGLDDGRRYTLQEIGDQLQITKEYVRRLEIKALGLCRDALSEEDRTESPRGTPRPTGRGR